MLENLSKVVSFFARSAVGPRFTLKVTPDMVLAVISIIVLLFGTTPLAVKSDAVS